MPDRICGMKCHGLVWFGVPQSGIVSQVRNTLLAKLVICISVVVALASSAPPRWVADDAQQVRVALDVKSEQKLLLTIELGGRLYSDTFGGGVALTATADRAATDFTLAARSLTQSGPPESPLDSGAGAEADGGSGVLDAHPTLVSPNEAALWLELECPGRPLQERAETCTEQFEITLLRESDRPLSAQLGIITTLRGGSEGRPPGTFQVSLAELPQ